MRPFLRPGQRDSAEKPWSASSDNLWWRPQATTYISSDALLPGDILLFSPDRPSATEQIVQKVQAYWGSPGEHARFTHAALYIGIDHLICEAVPIHGVVYSSLEPRLSAHGLLVRRWPNLTLQQRYGIAAAAVKLLGMPYGWQSALLETLSRGLGSLWDEDAGRGLVCSRLCDRSITLALLDGGFPPDQLQFHPTPGTWVTPAVLSASSRLVDVELEWRRVDPASGR